MNAYGLIGFPLTHSFSAEYFTEKFFRENIHDTVYELFPVENISKLIPLIEETKNLKGLGVTIPYKQQVMPFLTHIDKEAESAGAVNVIKIKRNNGLILEGFNTDIFGFSESIKHLLQPKHKKALVLGTGGAARAVVYALRKAGVKFCMVSGSKKDGHSIINYSDLTADIILSHQVIINATPVGMFPHISNAPDIPYSYITKDHLLFDLIYNPGETEFMKKGKEKGAVVSNGLQMLYLQAEKAWEIWNEES